ncbi:hypothetical protein RISINGSUN_70 [Erwinia phage vB_EamM_RisingSun]|uniref:Uncharacterized protein n=1 Tax=Erwinia phage vB_EamM_RisingSun TaxID=2026080 RepID=A0A223LHZ5_9CAUD|nr:hypothetical protein FDI45_gp070 [Erwinia phage vB_EamM_RisingSun]ASU03600.1 hypothetical protein RISINGSUN_70 [Erwinia phage vB_EamM_RisingSun]
MRVAIMNTAAIINNTLSADKQEGFNPNLLSLMNVSEKLFKIESPSTNTHALLVEKIDLGELFCNTPIDLRGLTFTDSPAVDLTGWTQSLNVDIFQNLPKLDNEEWEYIADEDVLGKHFLNAVRLTGLVTLSRTEVSLSVLDNVMTIEADNAMLYKGKVDVLLPE